MITGATFEDTFSCFEGYLHLKAAFKGHLPLTKYFIVVTSVGCKDDTDSALGRNKNCQADSC